jgi:hypothetical protein
MRACFLAAIGLLIAASAARAAPAAQPGNPPVTALVVHLVDEQGKPLTNQSICMMPVSVGYPQAEAGGPYNADKDGKVTIESLSPGEHRYVLRQEWPVPTFVTFQVPPAGLQTKVVLKRDELPGARPDIDIKAKVHEENGKRTVDLVISSNTEQPYELRSTDLQLVSGDYRIFPPASAVPTGGTVPAKSKGNLQLAIDWDEYLHGGLWVSRRGEHVAETVPATPAGEGMAYYRVVVANTGALPFVLPKLERTRGRVIDYAGKGVSGATVYLSSNQAVELYNGKNEFRWPEPVPYRGPPCPYSGSRAVADKDGRFTLTLVGGDRLVVVAGQLVWVARLEAGKEQTIRLPHPGKATIAYEIEGAAKEGVFRLQLMSWDMPDWRGVVQTTLYVKCPNGQTIDVADLTPGEYDVFREIDGLRVGDLGHSGMLDRGTLKVESGKAAKLEYVRTKGCPISGQVVGLKEAGLPGAFIDVRPEQATGDPRADEWKLTFFDALVTGPDGQFKTSRIAPGTYMVTAEASKPADRSEDTSAVILGGWLLPGFVGKVKVVVPESGEVKPIRIEIAPLSDKKAAAPASQPAPTVAPCADKPASAPAAARTIADVKTLEDLQNVETIHVNKRWAVRLGLSDGGKDAGPWKLLYCLADFPSVKNTDPALPPPASELSGVMGSLGPVMFTVDDPEVLQKSLQPAAGEVMTENGLVYCAAIPTAWKGTYRIRVWTWDKRLLAERVISVDQPASNYWQDLVGSELYPPTIRPGPYALAGPSAAYPSYEREVIWSLPRGEAQPLKGQATALPGQIPAGNGMYLEKTLGQEIPKKADRPNPLKLSIAAGCLHIDAPVEKMENPSGHHLLARWWVNGKPVPPNPPQNENYRASGPTYPAKSFSFPLTLPGHLGAKAGDKVTLQVLYCPLGFEYLRAERFRNSERPRQSPETPWRLPLLSEPLEFVATSAMLLPSASRPSGAKVVTQLVDEQGKPLTNQSISVMPVTVGYPQVEAGGPYYADKDGKVTIDSVSPGEHQYVLRQQWPVPTFVAGGLQTKVTVKKGELSGGIPDIDIKARVHEENGKRTMDLVISSNTEQPYELRSTDLQLVSGDYRIFPPPSAVPTGGTVPARSKGNLQLALDWDEYTHSGLWVSRRGEDIRESIPARPAGEGLAYYRVDVGNCYSLPFELPKLDKFQGTVIDHAGRGLAGATVYLASNQSLQLVNGQPGGGHWYNGRLEAFDTFKGSKAVTDKDGRFTLPVVGGDRLVIVAGDMVWLARVQTGKEQAIKLPQPGKVTISYDIDGAAQEGVFRLQLMTWDMPDWRGAAGVERYVTCGNGGTLEVDGLPPGEYDVCRWIEALRVGDIGQGGMLDRCALKIEAGKTAKLEFVRTKGCPISGQVVGLKEAGAPGAFVNVRPEQATGVPYIGDDWKLTFFDTLATGPDGQFKTSRIAPGTYMVTAAAYKPEVRTSGGFTDLGGIRMPNLLGKTKVVVPESGEVKPIRIEIAPLKGDQP